MSQQQGGLNNFLGISGGIVKVIGFLFGLKAAMHGLSLLSMKRVGDKAYKLHTMEVNDINSLSADEKKALKDFAERKTYFNTLDNGLHAGVVILKDKHRDVYKAHIQTTKDAQFETFEIDHIEIDEIADVAGQPSKYKAEISEHEFNSHDALIKHIRAQSAIITPANPLPDITSSPFAQKHAISEQALITLKQAQFKYLTYSAGTACVSSIFGYAKGMMGHAPFYLRGDYEKKKAAAAQAGKPYGFSEAWKEMMNTFAKKLGVH
jgi:hypothetical protein